MKIFKYLPFLLLTEIAVAEVIRDYTPARHSRFVGFPSNLAANPTFLHAGEDMSGIGWLVADVRRHFTLISPKHFVGASHFPAGVGSQVRFVNTDGEIKTYTVAARYPILNDESPPTSTDLFVGELTEAIPAEDKIFAMPILNLATESLYVNQELVITGRFSRAGRGSISAFLNFGEDPLTEGSNINETRSFTFLYRDPDLFGTQDDARVEVGDSGSPSLALTPDGFALVGNHLALSTQEVLGVTTFTNFDTFVAHYLTQLDAVMAPAGYNAIRSNPTEPELSISMTEASDPTTSSEGASYEVTVSNAAGAETAHNLELNFSSEGSLAFNSGAGSDWVVENGVETLTAIRGGLAPGQESTFTVMLSLPDTPLAPVVLSVNLQADGVDLLSASESTDILLSYETWAANLSDMSKEGDPDRDGLSNEIEYALGRQGDLAESEPPLALSLLEGAAKLSFQTRGFQGKEQLANLASSPDLMEWALIDDSSLSASSPQYGILSLVGEFAVEEERSFFRLRIQD